MSQTVFKIWKVYHGCCPDHSWTTYSLRQGPEIPIVLQDKQFQALFPSIDPATVPLAPATGVIVIKARMK